MISEIGAGITGIVIGGAFVWLALKEKVAIARAYDRCSDSRNVLLSRIDRLKSIAASQQSVKSGRIVAVLEGRGV